VVTGPAVATAVCALACAVLVSAEVRGDRTLRAGAKLVASAAFISIVLTAGAASTYARWTLVALVLGGLGDAFLLGASRRTFLAGLVAFLLGHLAFVVAFATVVSPPGWPSAASWAIAPVVLAAALALRWLWPHAGAMRGPVVGYVVVITMMVIAALAVARAGELPVHPRQLIAVGALAFFASDLAVARDRFVVKAVINKAWGLPAYYLGQVCLAWAAL
jgi:uncharacterized membrane protein YhhN